MRILVVGASGYIGGRLVPLLASRGHELVLMSRDARPLAARFPHATVVAADLLDHSTLPMALERIDVTYYPGTHRSGAIEIVALTPLEPPTSNRPRISSGHVAGPGRCPDFLHAPWLRGSCFA